MAKQYIQEKIYGNPGQMVTINRSNIISNSIYKPTNKVIKVNGPANANIYAAYITDNTDIPYPDIKGILVYDHIFTYTSNNNVSITNFNLDTWMSSTYGPIYTTTFTYVSSHSGNKWRVNNTSTYVNINNLGISYTMTSGSAPQNGTIINITADYSKSRYEIWVPSIGNWNVVCVGAAGYSENKIEIVSNTNVYYMDVAIFQAFISVNYTRGAECTITNIENNLTLTADNTEGYYTFTVPYTGIWRIRVEQTFGTGNDAYVKTKYDSVLVSTLNQQITRTVELISNVLDDCTWEEIKYVADQHMGDKYWQIGDCKAITLNGPLYKPLKQYVSGSTEYIWTPSSVVFKNYCIYAFIIGFDHNAEVEGSGITFQLGKLDATEELSGLNWKNNHRRNSKSTESSGEGYNQFYYSAAPWATNRIRTANLGSVSKEPYVNQITPVNTNDVPTGYDGTQGYLGNSIMALIPSDLRSCLKSVKKYTNNGAVYSYSEGGWPASYYILVNNSAYEDALQPYLILDAEGKPNRWMISFLSSCMFVTFTCYSVNTYSDTGNVYDSSWIIQGKRRDGTDYWWTYSRSNINEDFGIEISSSAPRIGDSFIVCQRLKDSDSNLNPIVSQTNEYIFLPSNYEVLGNDAFPNDITRSGFIYDTVDYLEYGDYQPPQYTLTTNGSGFTATLNADLWSRGYFGSRTYAKLTYNSSQNRWVSGYKYFSSLSSIGVIVQGTPTNGSEIIVTSPKTYDFTITEWLKVTDFNETLWNSATFTYNGNTYYFKDMDCCVFSYYSNTWALNYYTAITPPAFTRIDVDLSQLGITVQSTYPNTSYYYPNNSSKLIVKSTNSAGSFVPNDKQVQYEYFTNPNNRLRYYYTGGTDEDASSADGASESSRNVVRYFPMRWHTRSPSRTSDSSTPEAALGCINSATELSYGVTLSGDVMLCPCFVVGSEDE